LLLLLLSFSLGLLEQFLGSSLDNKFRSRKFGLTLLAMVLASVFLYLGLITEVTWSGVMLAGLAMYQTSNVMEKRYVGSDQ